MKISISLLLLSLGLAFGAGYIALQVRQSEGHQFTFSVSEIANLKRKFREKKRVVDELNTTVLFSPQAGFELLDPRLVISPSRGRSFSTVASVFRADTLCKPNLITDSSFSKIKLWIRYRCHQNSQLPSSFFEEPPYMSPFGISFANLARTSDFEIFQRPEWIQKNIQYFHSLELSTLPSNIELDPKRKILSLLEANILTMMTSGQSWIGSEKYIFVRRNAEGNGDFQRSLPTADYLIYSRTDWDQFLTNFGIETRDNPSAGCSYHDDGLCWVKASTSERKIQWTLGLLFILAVGIIGFCVLQIIRNIKNQRREE